MDPRLLQMIANMFSQNKLGDPSSAAFDPVQALLTGTYQPAPKFTEEQLYQRLAPTMLYAASEGPDSPYAIAASQIKAGTAPWTLKNNKELRGKIKSKDWDRFIDDLAKETQAIRAKMLDMELEQDPFQKQGMRGLNAQFTPEDTYKYAPKEYAKIFAGLEDAQKAEAEKFKKIDELYGRDVVATSREDVLKLLANKERTNPDVIKRAREFSPTNWKKHVATFAKTSAENKLKENPLMSILDVGASTKLKAFSQGLKDVEARKAGTASNKMAEAGKLSENIIGALTSAGITPTMEDILRNLATRKALKNG